jgi:hypothetical protein
VYFYTRGGSFKSEAFVAVLRFVNYLEEHKRLKDFVQVRAKFEDFLVDHKEATALIVHKYGTGERNIPWLFVYYKSLFDQLLAGSSPAEIKKLIAKDHNFAFLSVPPPPKAAPPGKGKSFTAGTKTAAYFAQALQGAVKCGLCGARVHKNSMQIDHVTMKKDGGHGGLENAQVAHPYCNSIKQ